MLLIIVGLILIISEFIIPVFGFFALIGLGLVIAGGSLAYDPSIADYGMAMILACSFALSLIVVGGLTVAFKVYLKKTQTGKEGMIGDSAKIVEWDGKQGRVFIDGEHWHAESKEEHDLKADDSVRVLHVQDLTLIIEPKK